MMIDSRLFSPNKNTYKSSKAIQHQAKLEMNEKNEFYSLPRLRKQIRGLLKIKERKVGRRTFYEIVGAAAGEIWYMGTRDIECEHHREKIHRR